jgi:hypothetical protein
VKASRLPNAHFLHVTITAPDCFTDEIRQAGGQLRKAWHNLIEQRVFRHSAGWLTSLEVVGSKPHPWLENVHVHAAVVMRPSYSGRERLSAERWRALIEECGAGTIRDGYVRAEKNVDTLAAYVIKYNPLAFQEATQIGIQNPERLIERKGQLKGLKCHTSSGVLKDTVPANVRLSGLSTDSEWRKLTRQLAMHPASFEPIPSE